MEKSARGVAIVASVFVALGGDAFFCDPAFANETITYTYDAVGRLTAVSHSGTVNNGLATSYTFDNTDNRTNVTTSGASSPPPPVATVIVPLNGQTLINIPAN